MYYSCHCIKRNGLQHDCRRTGCQGEPACLTLPDPVCLPSQLARARGLADPAPLAAHMRGQGGGSPAGPSSSAAGGGKKFIVCELKGVAPDVATNNSGKCCKCPGVTKTSPRASGGGGQICNYSPAAPKPPSPQRDDQKCPCAKFTGQINKAPAPPPRPTPATNPKCVCSVNLNSNATYVFDEKITQSILDQFETKQRTAAQGGAGPNARPSNRLGPKEECTRPGCVHWKPPPPCVWDIPCKADCFETPAGIQPGRNPWGNSKTMKCVFESSEVARQGKAAAQRTQPLPTTRAVLKMLTPECCTGCAPTSGAGAGAAAASGGPGVGLPVLVMKLC